MISELEKRRTSGRFASLMELYENNYILARLLIPGLREAGAGVHISKAPGCLDLELSQIEHQRYTTTFNLTYRFTTPGRSEREPDLTIRLYHDARTCEVVSGLISNRRTVPRRVRQLDESRLLNRFLCKWLRYCLKQGHSFEGCQSGQPETLSARTPQDISAG